MRGVCLVGICFGGCAKTNGLTQPPKDKVVRSLRGVKKDAPLGNRVIRVKNGGIESIETCEHPARVEDIAW